MGSLGLHVPSSLSPVLVNVSVEQPNHDRAKFCQKQQQQQQHELGVYETETGIKTISKLNTSQRQQLTVLPSDGDGSNCSSAIAEAGLKSGDTNRSDINKRCTRKAIGSLLTQCICSTSNQSIESNHSLPPPPKQPVNQRQEQRSFSLNRGDSTCKNELLFPSSFLSSFSSTSKTSSRDRHITEEQEIYVNYSHPLRQTTRNRKYHKSRRFAPTNQVRAPLFSAVLSLIVFIILFQHHRLVRAESVQERVENNLLKNQPLEHEVILTTPAATTTTLAKLITPPIQSSSSIGEFFSKISSAFKKSTTTTTPIPTTTSAFEPATEPDNYTEDESSIGRNDDDPESCSGLSTNESAETKNLTDNERLVNLQSCFQRKVKKSIKEATRNGLDVFDKLSLSGGCSSSLMRLASGLSELKSFAFKFLDASAKIPSGVMYGLLSDYGDFDECLAIKSDSSVTIEEESNEGAFSGKYCLISAKLNYHVDLTNTTGVPDGIIPDGILWDELLRNYWTVESTKGFQFGMCVPSRCTNDDLDQLYQYLAKIYNVEGKIISCQDGSNLKQQSSKDLTQQMILYAFYGLIGLTIIATILDRYYPRLTKTESHQKCSLELLNQLNGDSIDSAKSIQFDCIDKLAFGFKILTCFSIIKNWNLFTRNDQPGNNQWDCPSEFYSSPVSTNRNSHVVNESVDSEGTSLDKKEIDSPVESTINIFKNQSSIEQQQHQNLNNSIDQTINDDKLCQLIVRIQPINNPKFTCGKSLRHLSGLKLLVIIWITIGHSFLYPSANNYQYYRSIINIKITKDSVWFATTNFTLGIDMLLYMIGLSFVYKLAKLNTNSHCDYGYSMGFKNNNWGILRLISKKVLRFWPTYLTLIAIAIIVPTMSDGPMWPEMVSKRIGDSCRKNWWSNLLFINNFFKETEICLPSSWFVSILMQLFLIGSVVILITSKVSIKIGLFFISALLVISCAISFAFACLSKVRAPMVRMDESFVMELDENIFSLYTNIFNNLGPFLVGMLGGFILIETQIKMFNEERRVSVKKRTPADTNIIGTIASKINLNFIFITFMTIIIAVLVLSTVFFQEYSLFWSSTYWSLHRVGWAIVTGYIIHNCATGRFQLLNDFLSLSTFIPLSRLIPIAYLVYPILIHIHSGLVRDGLHVSIYNMLNIYITRLSMTFIVAFFIHILVELPLCSIEEIYLNRWVKRLQISEEKNKKSHPLLAAVPVMVSSRSVQGF